MIFFILLISFFANAKPATGVEIYSAESVQESKTKTSTAQSLIPQKRKPTAEPKKRAVLDAENTNQLPSYFDDNHHAEIKSKVILSTETRQEKLMSVRAGDTAQIEILHSIIAFPDEKAPVVAVIKSGALTGAKLFGSSTLEKNSKRIFIEFERASFAGSTYELKGSAITENGIQGFMGEHHSRPNSEAHHILTGIRDEAHRFAISYHRKLRENSSLESELDCVVGLGEKRKKELLKSFPSVEAIRLADIEQIIRLDGFNRVLAERILLQLAENAEEI